MKVELILKKEFYSLNKNLFFMKIKFYIKF